MGWFSDNSAKKKVDTSEMVALNNIIVTTGDLKESYDVIGPVYFQVSNKGFFAVL